MGKANGVEAHAPASPEVGCFVCREAGGAILHPKAVAGGAVRFDWEQPAKLAAVPGLAKKTFRIGVHGGGQDFPVRQACVRLQAVHQPFWCIAVNIPVPRCQSRPEEQMCQGL